MVRDYPSKPLARSIYLNPPPISLQCSLKITKKLGLEAMNLVMGREREERGGAHTMDERRRSSSHRERSGRRAASRRSLEAWSLLPAAVGVRAEVVCLLIASVRDE